MKLAGFLVASALPIAALAGCLGETSSTGQFRLYVTDAPEAIDQFEHLNVSLLTITLHPKDGNATTYRPIGERFDLTRLLAGNVSEIMDAPIAAGNYTKIELGIANATGVLKEGGEVEVTAPGGKLFVATPFEVVAGETTHFVFDIVVIEKGNGGFQFQPNANGSGPRGKEPENVVE